MVDTPTPPNNLSSSPPTLLMVIDESDSAETGVFGLAALLVPVEKVEPIRRETYRFLRALENPDDGTLTVPPEMHGSEMLGSRRSRLPWAEDSHRLRCYEHVAATINEHRLAVVRSAYVKRSVAGLWEGDNKHHSLCFMSLLWAMAPALERAFVIPMIDLEQRVVAKLAHPMHVTQAFRSVPGIAAANISVRHAHNLMDPVFVDSRFSPLMQLADVTAYLLHVLDRDRQGRAFDTDYKRGVLSAAKTLDASLVTGAEAITMQIAPNK